MSFLDKISEYDFHNAKFPVEELLTDSLYYPSCGFDGGVIKDCNLHQDELGICSFIYCDYATGKDALMEELDSFVGYHVFTSRSVSPNELTPNNWIPQMPPNLSRAEYTRYRDAWQRPFAHWIIYERDENRTEDHGPLRFSLLYICGEGVATYQALYWSNKKTAKAVAIIQPGTGFGLNWTDFRDPESDLAWVISNNPTGLPEYIYGGGYGTGYDRLGWEGYDQVRIINEYYAADMIRKGEVRLWGRSN